NISRRMLFFYLQKKILHPLRYFQSRFPCSTSLGSSWIVTPLLPQSRIFCNEFFSGFSFPITKICFNQPIHLLHISSTTGNPGCFISPIERGAIDSVQRNMFQQPAYLFGLSHPFFSQRRIGSSTVSVAIGIISSFSVSQQINFKHRTSL